jgi:hypothetical protein
MQRLMQNGALQAEGTPSIGAPGALGHVPPLLMAIKACRSEEQSKHRRSKADRGWGSARRRTARPTRLKSERNDLATNCTR